MAIKFLNDSNITNIFIQNNEPTVKNGIWIKSDNLNYSKIVEVADENSLVANSINIVKGTQYEAVLLKSNIINGLHYKFNAVYKTDENNDIDHSINIYYGNDTSWKDITGHIYGVRRLRNSSSSAWERTEKGVGLIANATHDGTEVQNDFDTIYPWSDIKSFNYNSNTNEITAYYGDEDFTFTPEDSNINVFTKIPQFWYKRWIDENDYEHIQIADYAAEGFLESKEFAIARYFYQNSTSTPRSISGLEPLTSTTGENYKTGAKNMSSHIDLLDWISLGAIQLLYLVEYADYNSQTKLGRGICNGSKSNSGQLDSLGMKSGCLNDDDTHSVMYRGIEDIFGNIYQLVDGVNIKNRRAYVCTDFSKYDFDTNNENYTPISYINGSSAGYISKLGLDENYPLLMLPVECLGTSDSTFITDYYYQYTNNMAFRFGGDYTLGSYCGMFSMGCSSAAGSSNTRFGARLLLRK